MRTTSTISGMKPSATSIQVPLRKRGPIVEQIQASAIPEWGGRLADRLFVSQQAGRAVQRVAHLSEPLRRRTVVCRH
jgi:hypothetical protein